MKFLNFLIYLPFKGLSMKTSIKYCVMQTKHVKNSLTLWVMDA